MTRSTGTSVENNFTRGLISEATGVNSPENSVSESLNVFYDRRGRAGKRKGLELEEQFGWNPVGSQVGAKAEYVWETVADNTSLDFAVAQIGSTIHFFESSGELPLSRSKKSFTVNLLTYKVGGVADQTVRDTPCSFSSGRGYLFVAHPNCNTLYVSYNTDTDTVSVKTINLQVRDFEGVEDGLALTQRPTTLSPQHKYNLFNQGWDTEFRYQNDSQASLPVLTRWDQVRNDFPSNRDVWWYFLRTSQEDGEEFFVASDSQVSKIGLWGNTPAVKGHHILSAYDSNRNELAATSGVPEYTSSGQRASVVAFYAGRVFYAGVGKSGFSQKVYFSQIVERDEQMGWAYQNNDPTSREISDLLDSDGGVIEVQDVNAIYDMRVVGDSLIVFASNGVWSVSGSDNGAFRATDYKVSKVSAFPAISRSSVVVVSGTPIWWNYEGIFTLTKSELGVTNDVTSLTTNTIQTFYDEIPQASKRLAKGVFNDQEKLIYWLYSTDGEEYRYDRILVMDASTGAFYPYSIPSLPQRTVSGLVAARSTAVDYTEDPVVTLSLDTVVRGTDPVVINVVDGFRIGDKIFKFLTLSESLGVSFSELNSESYLDWGQNYDAYFTTGYRIRGELLKKSQTNYLTVITEDVINSSIYMQPLWDYSNSSLSGRFGNPQQAYRTRVYKDYQRVKLKVRGSGYSLQFRFFGESGKPFVIIGWAGFDSVTGAP